MRHAITVAAILVHFAAGTSFAVEGRDAEVARALYVAGLRMYNLGDYSHALEQFRTAYRRKGDPALLFNIGQCQRQLGDHDAAARSFRAYLRESPNITDEARADVQRLVDDMERRAQEHYAQVAPTGIQAPALPPDDMPSRPSLVVDEPQPRPWHRNPWGWTLTASGVAVVVVGAGLLGAAAGLQSGSAATLGGRRDQLDEAARYQAGGWALFGIGAAGAVAGVIVFAFDAHKQRALTLSKGGRP